MVAELEGQTLYRDFRIADAAISKDARTIELSFSSEEPVLRLFGVETLGHKASEVDLSRLNDGGPLLLNHDMGEQIGVVEKAYIEGGKGRALVRFSRREDAEEVFQDVLDGIRRNVSVGYQVTRWERTKAGTNESPDEWRAVEWMPYEVSLVSVPADQTVGVGRSVSGGSQLLSEERVNQMSEKETPSLEKPVVISDNEAVAAERQRVTEISIAAEKFGHGNPAIRALRDDFIATGQSVGAFRAVLLDEIGAPRKITLAEKPELGLTEKEIRQFSLCRFLDALAEKNWSNAGFEREVSRAACEKYKKNSEGFLPLDVLKRAVTTGTTGGATGGNLVPTTLLAGSFIELLRNRASVMEAGATKLDGLVGDINIPRQDGSATGYWISTEGSAPTESQPSFGQVGLRRRTVGTFVDVTRAMLKNATPDIEALVISDLISVVALAIDSAAINGTGSSGQPTGILNASGIGSVAGDTNGATPTWEHMNMLYAKLGTANSSYQSALTYLSNSKVAGKLMSTTKFANTGFPILDAGYIGMHRFIESNQVPGNLTKGTASGVCSAIILGRFSEMLIGMWGGLDFLADPYTFSNSGTVRYNVLQDVDIALRHVGSFAAMRDALTTGY